MLYDPVIEGLLEIKRSIKETCGDDGQNVRGGRTWLSGPGGYDRVQYEIKRIAAAIRHTTMGGSIAQEAEERKEGDRILDDKIGQEAETRKEADAELLSLIDSISGTGGFLDEHDFGTAEPAPEALTEYACLAIWDKAGTGTGVFVWNPDEPWESTFTIDGETHTAAEIPNGTKIPNAFDHYVWALANPPNSDPRVFSWANIGPLLAGPASETYAGVLKLYKTIAGINTDGAITQEAAKSAFDSTANVYTIQQIFARRGELSVITLATIALDPIKGTTPPRRGDLVQSTIDGRIAQIEMIDTTAGTVAARTLNIGVEELDGKVDEVDGDVLANQYSMSYHDPKRRAFVVESLLDNFIGQIDVNGNPGVKSVRLHALDYTLQNGNKILLTPTTFQIEKIRNGVAEYHDIVEADDIVLYENAAPGVPADAQSFKNQIENIKSLGHILGGVHSQTELPSTIAAIMALFPTVGVPSINDVIQVEIDSDHSGMATWYTIVSIDADGNVTYSYSGSYSGSAQQRNFITDPIKIDEEVTAYTTPASIADDKIKFANNSNQGLVKSVFDKMVAKINGAFQSVSDLASNVTTALAGKQATLIGTQVTGQNLKTVGGTTLLGTGDVSFRNFTTSPINIGSEVTDYKTVASISENTTKFAVNTTIGKVSTMFDNIVQKINGLIQGLTNANTAINGKQATLVSGTNIKTVNGNNILGSGNIDLSALGFQLNYGSTSAQVSFTFPSWGFIYVAIRIQAGSGAHGWWMGILWPGVRVGGMFWGTSGYMGLSVGISSDNCLVMSGGGAAFGEIRASAPMTSVSGKSATMIAVPNGNGAAPVIVHAA